VWLLSKNTGIRFEGPCVGRAGCEGFSRIIGRLRGGFCSAYILGLGIALLAKWRIAEEGFRFDRAGVAIRDRSTSSAQELDPLWRCPKPTAKVAILRVTAIFHQEPTSKCKMRQP